MRTLILIASLVLLLGCLSAPPTDQYTIYYIDGTQETIIADYDSAYGGMFYIRTWDGSIERAIPVVNILRVEIVAAGEGGEE